jgi:hypothetical protein
MEENFELSTIRNPSPARRLSPPFAIRRSGRLLAALLAASLLGAARCATVAHGTTQRIEVESNPAGAVVSLSCVEGSVPNLGVTPIGIDVQRKSKSCAVEIAKEGYFPVNVPLQRTFSGVYVGNLLVGGVVGLVADAASGAMYKQGPPIVRVDLVPQSRQPVVTVPGPEPQTRRRMLKDRNGTDVAWMADDPTELAPCARVGKYDASQVTSEGRADIADAVVRTGGDTVFNPNGGAMFDIYRCGSESGVAQRVR